MDLWNEYEGRSIDGIYPLERLIRPEGRSAFFTTTTSGKSTVIRLIESHFDEDEILARWAGVSDLHQPHLLTLTRYGQAMMDGTSLVYVVLEPTEADLSQILCERPLTLAETREVAAGLIAALQALHTKGFVHEHVQAVNVLAVGEVVKLRSDCIREAPGSPEGDALRSRDVQDLATLLLQCLTLHRSHAISPTGPPLPAPLREIIHNGISGAWGLAQMATALEVAVPPQRVDAAKPTSPAASMPPNLHRSAVPADALRSPSRPTAIKPVAQPSSGPAALRAEVAYPQPAAGRIRVPMREQTGAWPRWLLIVAVVVLCSLSFAAYLLLSRHSGKDAASNQPAASGITAASPIPPATSSVQPATTAAVAVPALSNGDSWRVVAYTYYRQDQAAGKARSLEQRFPELHPLVFAPTGRAPFLVTLGGRLGRDAAFKLRDKLRRSGLPRDLYAQNYVTRSR